MRRISRKTIAIGLAGYMLFIFLGAALVVASQPPNSLKFSDWMSLFQVVLSFLILPTVILFVFELWNNISFVDAHVQLRYWVVPAAETPLYPKHAPDNYYLVIEPALNNLGNSASVWYTLRICVPLDLYKGIRPQSLMPIGNEDNWKITPHEGNMVYTFLSNGRYALLPGDNLILAQWFILLPTNSTYDPTYKVRYHLLTDQGKEKRGSFTIEMEHSTYILTQPS